MKEQSQLDAEPAIRSAGWTRQETLDAAEKLERWAAQLRAKAAAMTCDEEQRPSRVRQDQPEIWN